MIKDIFQELIETLSGIKELRYVASDWGQLDYEQPPVQWPCALIDMPGLQCGTSCPTGFQAGERQHSV